MHMYIYEQVQRRMIYSNYMADHIWGEHVRAMVTAGSAIWAEYDFITNAISKTSHCRYCRTWL